MANTTQQPVDGERKRFLSGVQPSGKLHLGNYFGAIKQHIDLQDRGDAFYFIANLHALTTVNDAGMLRDLTRDVALDYLALGLDPERATFFRQSDVTEVCELTWMLSTVTGMGLLERAVSYKEKLDRGIPARAGLAATRSSTSR
jgi:tryptophanyl-tRNA synthetase